MKKHIDKIKKIALYTVGIIFFGLILIWALLSANGRKLQFGTQTEGSTGVSVYQVGGIRINSAYLPKIKAEIDGKPVEIQENRIQDIVPGEHKLKLITEGFNDWYTSVNVKPGIIVDVNPLLLPIQLKLQNKIPQYTKIDRAFYATYGDVMFYVTSSSNKGVDNGIFKISLLTTQSIFGNDTTIAPLKITNISEDIADSIKNNNYDVIPSSDNRKILFRNEEGNYLIYNSENALDNQVPLDLEKILGYKPEDIYWFDGSSSLIIKHQNLLAEFEISTTKTILIEYVPGSTPIYSVNGDTVVFFSRENGSLYKYRNGDKIKIEFDNLTLPTDIDYIKIDKNSGTFAIFRSKNKYYYLSILDSYITDIGQDIEPIQLSLDGSGLIYKKGDNAYVFSVRLINPSKEYEATNRLLLEKVDSSYKFSWNNSSTNIQIAHTTDQGTTVLLGDKTGENILEVVKNNNINPDSIYTTTDNKQLLVLINNQLDSTGNASSGNLYYVSLIPETK